MQEAGLELSKSTFSHHLRILREAGLLTKRIQGARGYAQLRKRDVDHASPACSTRSSTPTPPPRSNPAAPAARPRIPRNFWTERSWPFSP